MGLQVWTDIRTGVAKLGIVTVKKNPKNTLIHIERVLCRPAESVASINRHRVNFEREINVVFVRESAALLSADCFTVKTVKMALLWS